MHFNEMSVKSRQFGLGFVSAALGLGIVLLTRGGEFSIVVPFFGGFNLHATVVALASALALYAVMLLDLNVYQKMLRGAVAFGEAPLVAKILDPAFHAFNSSRRRNIRLYPTVRETLDVLASSDLRLIAHTESKLYGVLDRLNRLDLFRYFSKIYCGERSSSRHPHPNVDVRWIDPSL